MQGVAQAVFDLPGLLPAAASLAALTRNDPDTVWDAVRGDPSAVALALVASDTLDLASALASDAALVRATDLLRHPRAAFFDWRTPAGATVRRQAVRQAALAAALAPRFNLDAKLAWACGLLAPLGWVAALALFPERGPELLHHASAGVSGRQSAEWGADPTAVVRRLMRAWRMPTAFAAVVGNLSLHADVAHRLGADPKLFALVQLAVLEVQRDGVPLTAIGAARGDLLRELHLSDADLALPPADDLACESPREHPLLDDLLRLARENRVRSERAWIERLATEIDRLHETLDRQHAEEQVRVRLQKLAALAEFAAGAGHEINNPLAVISGQAQYLARQLEAAEEQLAEDPSPALYVDTLKSKFGRALQTIVGQTQRIHQVLLDVMQFARPQPSKLQSVAVAKLIADAVAPLRALADERRVRLVAPETPANWALHVDPQQIRGALAQLVRNAIEAAPADGWASVRAQREADGTLAIVVEDNGPGLAGPVREHLFDPFFSGRSAGRGRGLGLPTAWRLARQHGGDVRHETADGVTRFVLSLPPDAVETWPETHKPPADPARATTHRT